MKWLLIQKFPDRAININFADLKPISKGNEKLAERICKAVDLFPCDVLFIHRDAEKESIESRENEIRHAIDNAECELPVCIPVTPIKMSEAWILIDIESIRIASGNPNGKDVLKLPAIDKLEKIPDPKKDLIELIKKASGLNKRRLKGFNPRKAMHRLAEVIEDYSRLRRLDSFKKLEEGIDKIIENL
ncbi:MAG: hypothetical protein H6559_16240 [Lewinellaceae bacterium]|nr:hypothetical protein [Lewinellaceae bacterium]